MTTALSGLKKTHSRLAAAIVLLSAFLSVQPLSAVTLVMKDGGETIRAVLVRKYATGVVVELIQPDGSKKRRDIPLHEIEILLDPIDRERLATLQADKPQSYRDYAEELAEKKSDPDARAMAIRLYLIAAHLDPNNLGKSSLLGMTSLARNEIEQRRFRAMVYLLDDKHDKQYLTSNPAPKATAPDTAELDAATSRVLLALKKLRMGKMKDARNLSRREGFEAVLNKYSYLNMEEFADAANPRCPQCDFGKEQCPTCSGSGRVSGRACPTCYGKRIIKCQRCEGNFKEPPLGHRLLQKVIRLELELLGERDILDSSGKTSASNAPPWSKLLREGQTRPAPSLSLETITEFDPRESIYRDGSWRKPD